MADKNLPAEPYASGGLDVGDGHTVYWETVGTPAGTPAVYLHGGPGSGSRPHARAYFDPARYRAVLFDQRGCGRSRPLASDPGADLSANTTGHLVADIERLRDHLGVDRWVVVGVSWGVTLALVYAQAHPRRVSAMVLGAITSGARHEIEWITRDMGRLFPAEWEAFTARVPPAERHGDLSAAYSRLLADPDAHIREAAARAWCAWEDTHVSLVPGWKPSPRYEPKGEPDLAVLAKSDGYATGFIAYALQQEELPGADLTLKRARAWLEANQQECQIGPSRWRCWRTFSLNFDTEHGGESGEPWRRMFMSDAATAFAALALLSSD